MKTNLGKKIDLTEKRRTFVGGAVKGIDAEKRQIRAYASTNAWDRYGERFEADAFKDGLEAFKKNPVILFAHDYGSAPIGKAIGYEFDTKGLILTMQFADTDKAKEVFALYEGGYMSAFSVGFRPKEYRWEEREAGVTGLVFVKAELLENSAVPVPANPEAVVIKGIGEKTMTFSGDLFRSLIEAPYRIAPKAEEVEETAAEPAADPAPAPVENPAEAPKSLKAALGYLIELGKTAREKGKVEDEAVRSMLTQAVNLCRELVYGPSTQLLDGMIDPEITPEQAAALVKEYQALVARARELGKTTPKDLEQLATVGKTIDELIRKSMKERI